ncbi:OmpA/MotB domain protein [Acetobacter orientalis]|uniref:OmpA/MotB domain protein n=1 Tax=Acetobacter orientalis TaxID=146474 RepID=A0A2Z5ZFG2_9PROT|nr:OmpA/MotB domain protein [Acetobacter orientalis]
MPLFFDREDRTELVEDDFHTTVLWFAGVRASCHERVSFTVTVDVDGSSRYTVTDQFSLHAVSATVGQAEVVLFTTWARVCSRVIGVAVNFDAGCLNVGRSLCSFSNDLTCTCAKSRSIPVEEHEVRTCWQRSRSCNNRSRSCRRRSCVECVTQAQHEQVVEAVINAGVVGRCTFATESKLTVTERTGLANHTVLSGNLQAWYARVDCSTNDGLISETTTCSMKGTGCWVAKISLFFRPQITCTSTNKRGDRGVNTELLQVDIIHEVAEPTVGRVFTMRANAGTSVAIQVRAKVGAFNFSA